VHVLTRLWFVLAGGDSDELDELARALGSRPLAALACAAEPSCRTVCAAVLARAGPSTTDTPLEESADLGAGGQRTLTELARLARDHADREVLAVAPRAALESALRCAIGLDLQGDLPVKLRPGALFAFDWPTGQDPATRPLLLGVDLDWLPAWTRGRQHARFPGGPGAAGTARA